MKLETFTDIGETCEGISQKSWGSYHTLRIMPTAPFAVVKQTCACPCEYSTVSRCFLSAQL